MSPENSMILRIGTRGSKLALTQSTWVKERIESAHPDLTVTLTRIQTTGDKVLDSSLSRIGGKGLFVKEIEEALLRNEVDLAVHSMKDVPGDLPGDLDLSAYPEREDPRDALVTTDARSLSDLPGGSAVGTGSLRRSSQLLHIRPDLRIVPLRGNVDTRLRKLAAGDFQAIVLAVAGLKRLGLSSAVSYVLPPEQVLPAIGQGALGLETRKGDHATRGLIHFLNHEDTETTVRAERALLKALGGGCQVPIAGRARLEGEEVVLEGMVAEPDGTLLVRDRVRGPRARPEELGVRLAERLLSMGADKILARIYGQTG
ncbi:MAG: hydroxymethylbilane synthase [Thermodesulfobacteriota bacterium]